MINFGINLAGQTLLKNIEKSVKVQVPTIL